MTIRKAAVYDSTSATWIPAVAIAILLTTVAFALLWSHDKLFWVDELLEFYSDTRSTFGAVVQGQLHYPFSLEPPAFHLLLHAFNRLLSSHAELASRLPSIVSLLVAQLCVFRVTRKLLKDSRAALLAMTFLFLFATFDFSAEARVYSLLSTLFALAYLAYEAALRREPGERIVPIAGLFCACAAAVLVHYYGLFLPLPFLAAEGVRAIRHRRIDWPVALVLVASLAVFALNLPFLPALAEIRKHYYGGVDTEAGWPMIPITYLWLIGQYNIYENNQYGYLLRFAVFFFTYIVLPAMLITLTLRQAKRETAISKAMFTALLTGFFLPVINIVVAHYRTHAYVIRYSVPAVVPLAILLAWLLKPHVRSNAVFGVILVVTMGSAALQGVHDIQHDRKIRAQGLADERATPDLTRALSSTNDQHVYMQDVAKFLTTYVYASASTKSSLVGMESIDRELFWLGRDPPSLFLRNMHCSTALPTISLEELRTKQEPHLLVVFDDPKEEWIGKELADTSRVSQVEPLGQAYGGRLLRVTFRPLPAPTENSAWVCRDGLVR